MRRDVEEGWIQYFKGSTAGNLISGQFFGTLLFITFFNIIIYLFIQIIIDSRTNLSSSFNGTRANIFSYGLFAK